MKTAQDFPRLKLCDSCSRLFTDYRDGTRSDHNSTRYHMWYERGGYQYCRTRRELEHAAVFGCVFCKAVASRDRKYQKHEDDSCGPDNSEDNTELFLDEQRPVWYPSLDEELELSIRYNWVDNVLYIWSRSGIEWSGGDLAWSMYATPSKSGPIFWLYRVYIDSSLLR